VISLDRRELGPLWDLVAERLQRNGLQASGTLVLSDLDRDARHALAGLLGRPIARDRVSVDLALLDRRLRDSGVATGLVAATDRLRGPLINRPGQRQARAAAVAGVWVGGHRALEEAGLAAAPWAEPWFDDLRRVGVLARVSPARGEQVLCTAVRCVSVLPHLTGDPPSGRGELASVVSGDAHGLDDGRLLGAVTLRAAAAITATPYPSSPAGRRTLWRAVGVHTDEVSTTALTSGLHSTSRCWLDERTDAGWESHLSVRDLRRIELCPPAGVVSVCENPRVLEAAVDAGCRSAVVCTQGQPAVVVAVLLDYLAAAGAALRYHGDFDWPGLTIANLLVGGYGCSPWRFSTGDYLDALARLAPVVAELPLLGDGRVEASWDPSLTAEMGNADRAVHEELVLEDLLLDLSSG
jgi:uncharacterized protein (TIGR02679 family)